MVNFIIFIFPLFLGGYPLTNEILEMDTSTSSPCVHCPRYMGLIIHKLATGTSNRGAP